MMKLVARVSGLGVLALGAAIGLAGCAESNDAAAVKTPGGKNVPGVTPPNAPKTSEEAMKAMQSNNPMMGKDYPGK
jgi:hypothetical protein